MEVFDASAGSAGVSVQAVAEALSRLLAAPIGRTVQMEEPRPETDYRHGAGHLR